MIIPSAYFAPIHYYHILSTNAEVMIEQYDNYQKQTFRNRCQIAGANGVQMLTVPIQKYDGEKCLMKDVKISDHNNWQHNHWMAIVSAYGNSPFFEFYADDILRFFTKKWEYLYDFNMEITVALCRLLDIDCRLLASSCFHNDFEQAVEETVISKPYYQVYKEKYGFIANLSILDLLFNMGNESAFYL